MPYIHHFLSYVRCYLMDWVDEGRPSFLASLCGFDDEIFFIDLVGVEYLLRPELQLVLQVFFYMKSVLTA